MLPEMQQPGTPYLRPDRFAAWYALDYFRKPTWRQRWKWWMTGLGVGLSLIWLIVLGIRGEESVFASGPVSSVHAREEVACGQCHTGWFRPALRLFNSKARSVRDADCAACHQAQAASPYHTTGAEDRSCALCHREHRGRLLLTHIPDGHCTTCHADLHRSDGLPKQSANVSGFASDHPPFRGLSSGDIGKLRFNHAVHCSPEGIPTPAGSIRILQCDVCHQPTEGGCYLALPRYDACRECHPITVNLRDSGAQKPLSDAILQFARQPLPHEEPVKVRAELVRRLSRLAEQFPEVVQPGRSDNETSPFASPADEGTVRDAADWVSEQVRNAEYQLFVGGGGCRLCHEPVGSVTADFVRGELPRYAPTNLRPLWLPLATFNHAVSGHRELDCSACHLAATSRQAADLLIPDIDNCRACHRPRGSARSDCAECHRYHQAVERRGTCKQAVRQPSLPSVASEAVPKHSDAVEARP